MMYRRRSIRIDYKDVVRSFGAKKTSAFLQKYSSLQNNARTINCITLDTQLYFQIYLIDSYNYDVQ
jgi:hypothetical protein